MQRSTHLTVKHYLTDWLDVDARDGAVITAHPKTETWQLVSSGTFVEVTRNSSRPRAATMESLFGKQMATKLQGVGEQYNIGFISQLLFDLGSK